MSDVPNFGGELRAMGREAAKDASAMLHQVFFNISAGLHEPGTPLAPTQQMVTQDLERPDPLADFSNRAQAQAAAQEQSQDKGMEK